MDYDSFAAGIRETGGYATARKRMALPWPLCQWAFSARMNGVYARSWFWSARRDFRTYWWPRLSYLVIGAVEGAGGTVRIEGFRNLDALGGGPAVIACNHVSAIETYVLPGILCQWNDVAYILKRSLMSYPVVGRCIRAIDPIPVDRKSPVADLRAVLKHGGAALSQGRFAAIFPEGTRRRLFDPSAFHSLGAKLALHSGVPVVPVAVATDFLRIGKLQRDLFATVHPSSPVRFACGEPIPASLGEAEIQRRATGFLSATLARWEVEDGRRMLLPAPEARA